MFDFSTLLVGGIPLIIVVFGLVEMIKALGAQGKVLTIISMLVGIALGICYQLAQTGIPIGFAAWFTVVIFGLMLGLVASGIYKFTDARFPSQPPAALFPGNAYPPGIAKAPPDVKGQG